MAAHCVVLLVALLAALNLGGSGAYSPGSVSPCALSEKSRCGLMAIGLKNVCECLRANGVCYDNYLEGVAPKQVKKKMAPICKDLNGFLDRCERDLPCGKPSEGTAQLQGLRDEGMKTNIGKLKAKGKGTAYNYQKASKPQRQAEPELQGYPERPYKVRPYQIRPKKPALKEPETTPVATEEDYPVNPRKPVRGGQKKTTKGPAKAKSKTEKPEGSTGKPEQSVDETGDKKFFSRVQDYLKTLGNQ